VAGVLLQTALSFWIPQVIN